MTTRFSDGPFAVPDSDKAASLRARLFHHLDGLALTAIVPVLEDHHILERFSSGDEWEVDALAGQTKANPGYLNVACRLLASQGWLVRRPEEGRVFFRSTGAPEWYAWRKQVSDVRAGRQWLAAIEGRWNAPDAPWTDQEARAMEAALAAKSRVTGCWDVHLEGALLAPWLVTLGLIQGTTPFKSWGDVRLALEAMHPDRAEACLFLLDALGCLDPEEGGFFLSRAAAYGVTTSYTKTFLWAEELMFGDGGHLWRVAPGEGEVHVDRNLNVWGSGGAHGAYFRHLDEVVREVFNQPLVNQPKGLCDMGCGNGALLLHLNEFIGRETLRGQHLDSHPLLLVGADFNQAALDATADHFRQEGVEGVFLWGDIGDPDQLDQDLMGREGLRLGDLLNVRSFLDHNRVFNRPVTSRQGVAVTTGAYAFRGERLRSIDVEQSLVEHFRKWRPHVAQHGLLVIELHTMAAAEAAERCGRMPATAYDATHGFSDQYIVEVPVYDAMALEAGLKKAEALSRTFPRVLPATVSLRYFQGTA